MSFIWVERVFAHPVSFEEIGCVHDRAKWCLDMHGVTPLLHGIDSAGGRSLCLYASPDVEAMRRIAGQMAIVPEPKMWSCSVDGPWRGPGPVPMLEAGESSLILLDRAFERNVEVGEIGAAEIPCSGPPLLPGARLLATYQSFDRTRVIHLCAASDPDTVKHANHTATTPFTEIWSVETTGARTPSARGSRAETVSS